VDELKEYGEGREFYLAIPHIAREAGEPIRGNYPIAIWVSSRVDTRVTVRDFEKGYSKDYVVRKYQLTEIPWTDEMMLTKNEEAKYYGINVESNDPITVSMYISYRWSGESYRAIPKAFLGKSYVTLNMYLDTTVQILVE